MTFEGITNNSYTQFVVENVEFAKNKTANLFIQTAETAKNVTASVSDVFKNGYKEVTSYSPLETIKGTLSDLVAPNSTLSNAYEKSTSYAHSFIDKESTLNQAYEQSNAFVTYAYAQSNSFVTDNALVLGCASAAVGGVLVADSAIQLLQGKAKGRVVAEVGKLLAGTGIIGLSLYANNEKNYIPIAALATGLATATFAAVKTSCSNSMWALKTKITT